ncbi:MAG TPA: DUF4198 domain-containing protein [Thermoanaerobaculia bacterium]|nr:DUF4198 domain-containing protein [Thermoanaerobaculia bacterium]
MRRAAWVSLVSLVSLTTAPALQAHDLWIEPSNFRPAPGERVAVRLRVGQAFRGDPVPRMTERIERFAAVGPGSKTPGSETPGGEIPLPGVEGTDPAGWGSLPAPGTWILVYDSDHSSVELDGPKFEAYLAEEGLERISRLRAQRGQTAARSREIYSRCAKALVQAGNGPAQGYDRVLGLPLELVPGTSPAGLPAGGELPVTLLFRGKPLAGALVVAVPRDAPAARVSGRTGADGRVRLRLDRPGDWLVKAVHMEPAPQGSGADWESFWASLSFRR